MWGSRFHGTSRVTGTDSYLASRQGSTGTPTLDGWWDVPGPVGEEVSFLERRGFTVTTVPTLGGDICYVDLSDRDTYL